jgi:hypothetical protein
MSSTQSPSLSQPGSASVAEEAERFHRLVQIGRLVQICGFADLAEDELAGWLLAAMRMREHAPGRAPEMRAIGADFLRDIQQQAAAARKG